jgi:ribosomal protein S27E
LLAVLLKADPWPWVIPVALAGWISIAIALVLQPRLTCVVCHGSIYKPEGHHCPECGERSIAYASGWLGPHCTNCGASLMKPSRGAGRAYKIRYCTHCGTHLDSRGL